MKKGFVRNQVLLVVLFFVFAFALNPLKGSAATYVKVIYSNYIDYTTYQKSNVIVMKMHKSTTGKVVWSSSNKNVATVTSTGKASAKVYVKGQGSCVIYAKVDGKTYKANVRAGKGQGASKQYITMSMIPTQEIMVGDTFTLKATLKPASLSSKNIGWKSSNSSVASVTQSGQVTLKKKGTATITAYYTKNHNLRVSTTLNVIAKKIYISKIVLNGPTTGYVGQTAKFTATITPSNATNKTLTWATSNASVATVDQNGVVTCKATGKVNISVTTNDGTKKTVTSQTMTVVTPRATELDIESSRIPQPLQVGDTFTLTASVKPDNARISGVTWYSSDDNVLTIDENGLVTCVGEGDATITVESDDPQATKLTDDIDLTVYKKANYITSLKITGPDVTVSDYDVYYSVKNIVPTDYEDKITWTSDNPDVAAIVDGDDTGCHVKTGQEGTAKITATTTTGLSTSIDLDVVSDTYPNKLEMAGVPKDNVKLYSDSTFTLRATLKNAKDDIVTSTLLGIANSPIVWTSSDPSVASVDENGNVTAHKGGTATITVKSTENPALKASATLTFNSGVAVTKLTLAKDNIPEVVQPGDEFDFVVTFEPANATNKDVTWISSDESVATVDQNGHFKALKYGTVTITVYLNDNPGKLTYINIPVGGYEEDP